MKHDNRNRIWRSAWAVCVLAIALVAGGVAQGFARAPASDAAGSEGVVTATIPMVVVMPYNFTPYGVVFEIGETLRGSAHPNAATGSSTALTPLRAVAPGTPVEVRWRYTQGPEATERGDYPFRATLREPARPEGGETVSLTIRFFPQGKVAMRYTLTPERSDLENVPPALSGDGWESNL